MRVIPKAVSRFGHRTVLKVNKNSPTILVVTGVVGLGVTAVMAAKATRNIDPVLNNHAKQRMQIAETVYTEERQQQREIAKLYWYTSLDLAKVYGPTIVVGSLSAFSVLAGHRILKGRHTAVVAAYTGLMDQFISYRDRVRKTLGEKAELDIYHGAHGEYVEDPNHKGEYKLQPKWNEDSAKSYLRPWFDEVCPNWLRDPTANYDFLRGVQAHQNDMLQIRGHVFLNEILDALRLPRTPEGAVMGWVKDSPHGDGYIDLGFMTGDDPQTVAFRNRMEPRVRLNFNVDNVPIWNQI